MSDTALGAEGAQGRRPADPWPQEPETAIGWRGWGGDIETSKMACHLPQGGDKSCERGGGERGEGGGKRGRRRRCKKGTGVDRSLQGQPPAEAGHVPLFIPLFAFC